MNGVFVQQFSDLYLSKVMGLYKGCRVEAQAPRELYFTQEAVGIAHTQTPRPPTTHTHTQFWI